MSQQVNTIEKNVAQEDAAIAIPDEEIVSINYISSFHLYSLTYLIIIFRKLPPIPLRNPKKQQQKAWQVHVPHGKM